MAAFCDEALDAVEAVAAGELTPDGRIAEHLSTCPGCAAALASARRIERMLRERPAPRAPVQFTARTLARVRRARWRSEQFLDTGFNVAIALVIIAIVWGVWILVRGTGLSAISTDAIDVFGRGLVTLTRRIAPSLPLYAGAMGVVGSALGIWWWAERDASP
jgi:anti-sigma factor RsiW